MRALKISVLVILAVLALGIRMTESRERQLARTIEDLLDLDVSPFAIAHRGFGDNLTLDSSGPADPSRPIENTVAAVRKGFRAGASVVEVDVQLTRDGEVAVFHDDFFSDGTCLNHLTLADLQHRAPFIPRLRDVLHEARRFNESSGPLRGLVILELKAAAPLCDPDDTQEHAIVAAVTEVVRGLRMTEQVMFTSFSPALLYIAAHQAPEITRILTISGLQFLTTEEVAAFFQLPVTPIKKKLSLGLQWAELGPIFRLPGYRSTAEVFSTAAITAVRVVEADLFFLSSAEKPFVDALHAFGLKALGFTATSPTEWFFLESLGLDGIYTNDVRFGVRHQAPSFQEFGDAHTLRGSERREDEPVDTVGSRSKLGRRR